MGISADDKLRAKITKLHALLGSSNEGERNAARLKIEELLAKHKLHWNDLPELLIITGNNVSPDGQDDADSHVGVADVHPSPLDLIRRLLQKRLHSMHDQL